MTLRSLGDAQIREIVEDYMEAIRSGDAQRVVTWLEREKTHIPFSLDVLTLGG